jgi:hypothetical protein
LIYQFCDFVPIVNTVQLGRVAVTSAVAWKEVNKGKEIKKREAYSGAKYSTVKRLRSVNVKKRSVLINVFAADKAARYSDNDWCLEFYFLFG